MPTQVRSFFFNESTGKFEEVITFSIDSNEDFREYIENYPLKKVNEYQDKQKENPDQESDSFVHFSGKRYIPEYYKPARSIPGVISFDADVSDVLYCWEIKSHEIGEAIAKLIRAGKKPGEPYLKDLHKAMEHIQRAIEYGELDKQEHESPY